MRAAEELPWFAALPAEQRSYVGLVLHAGPRRLRAVAARAGAAAAGRAGGLRRRAQGAHAGRQPQADGAAHPRRRRGRRAGRARAWPRPGDEPLLREAVLRYSREIAFAAADVYAAAAEARGAWDARVEAGVVDALVRGHAGELTLSRVGSLGWNRVDWVVALATPVAARPRRRRRCGRPRATAA